MATLGRPRSRGVLDKLIDRVTVNGYVYQLAALLDVSNRAVYAWDAGQTPSLYYQEKINALCAQVGLKSIYKAPYKDKARAKRITSNGVRQQQYQRNQRRNRNGKERNQRQRIHAV
jgi:hypothetical protein